jgi:hypothetical protein
MSAWSWSKETKRMLVMPPASVAMALRDALMARALMPLHPSPGCAVLHVWHSRHRLYCSRLARWGSFLRTGGIIVRLLGHKTKTRARAPCLLATIALCPAFIFSVIRFEFGLAFQRSLRERCDCGC